MGTHRIGRVAGVIVTSSLLLGIAATVAAQPDGEAFPGVGGGPPPDWVRPGTRLTWYGEAASVQTSYYAYVEDPEGDWEDPVTHKRYRRTEEDEMPTAAGRAWSQTDVLAVDGDRVALDTVMWGIDLETDQLSLTPLWGGCLPGAAVDGAWVRPDLLAGIESGGTRDLQVLRGIYRLGDTPVESVGFLSRSEGTYASTVFDAASGVLIASTGRAKAQGSPVHGPLDLPEGNVLIVWTRFVGSRQRDLPGLGAALPGWVAPGVELGYTGTVRITNPFDAYGFEISYPVETTIAIEETGAGWATYRSRSATDLNGYVERTEAAGAAGAMGTWWYDPVALGGMSVGDVLDEDPTTGARLTVDAADPATGVTLRTEAPGVSVSATYDADSGVVTRLVIGQAATFATVDLTLAPAG